MPRHARRIGVVALCATLGISGWAEAARPNRRTTNVTLSGLLVDGARERVLGHAVIVTPASFRRTSRNGAPSAHFEVTASRTCRASLIVAGRAVATSVGPTAQVTRTNAHADVVLASGTRPDGAWGLAEFSVLDPRTSEPTDRKQLYAIAVVRVRARRWMHVRAFATFGNSCTTHETREGTIRSALEGLVRTARVRVSIVSRAS